VETRKPNRLNALTGLRCLAAFDIVLFHFSNPRDFGFLAPVVNSGYIVLGLFFLLSGFVLAYNYAGPARAGTLDHVRFWKARFTRLYPVYLLSLLMSWRMVEAEYGAHTHAIYWTGMALTPLLLQGWIPSLATFLNTPAWAMPAEAFMYALFPWLARIRRPARVSQSLLWLAAVWALGLLPGLLYLAFNPDGLAHVDRWSWGEWLQALKYTPLPHLASFVFGILLAGLDELLARRTGLLRLALGLSGFAGVFGLLALGPLVPYVLLHDSLLMPLFGCIVLGLAGENWLASAFSLRPLVFVGEASYCLYLLHFNAWNWMRDAQLTARLGLSRFDPWISYALLIALALAALHMVEKPAQKKLRKWMGA
jgi:peptidoglycan/LPS O-acetylase OafA/YrhL